MNHTDINVAVIIPCHNEAAALPYVVKGFQRVLPDARILVFDNNSTDDTMAVAESLGAEVRSEPQQGKGHVVRRMFADVEADAYILVDGDGTYDPDSAPQMLQLLLSEHLDMVNARRVHSSDEAYRPGHQFGNRLLTGLVSRIFGQRTEDMLSGYRAFSRRFVKSFPALSTGFEIETELTVHALSLDMPIGEIDTPYATRPTGSASKLNTFRDGMRILKTILTLTKEERPLLVFSLLFFVLATIAIVLAIPVVVEWLDTGLVPRFPTAILAASTMLLAFLMLVSGIVLSSVTHARRELRRLQYLQVAWLGPNFRDGAYDRRRKIS